jgi:hypothetical protein
MENFISVCLDNLDIFEQYNIFKNAEIIIGQHGAGLCNIYFAEDNFKCSLIEITPEWNINNNWFKNLSKLCNINYQAIFQNIMTQEEAKEYIMESQLKDIDWNIVNKPTKNLMISPVITFIKNSGSVNIKKVLNAIEVIRLSDI